MEMDMYDEMHELESRIQDICKTMEERPKEAKYLMEDLHYFEEELKLLKMKDNLRMLKQSKRRTGDKADTHWGKKKTISKKKGGNYESEK